MSSHKLSSNIWKSQKKKNLNVEQMLGFLLELFASITILVYFLLLACGGNIGSFFSDSVEFYVYYRMFIFRFQL